MADTLYPGATIGIVGGGQSGRFLCIAASRLGYKTHVYCPITTCPAGQVANQVTVGAYDDEAKLKVFADDVDVAIHEYDSVPLATLRLLTQYTMLRPRLRELEISYNRLKQKTLLRELGMDVLPYVHVQQPEDIYQAQERLKTSNILLKSVQTERREKLYIRITEDMSPKAIWDSYGGLDMIAEPFYETFDEAVILVARDAGGNMAVYPMIDSVNFDMVFHRAHMTQNVSELIQNDCKKIAEKLADKLNLVGLMAVEFFVLNSMNFVVNEISMHPHAAGLWTLDGCSVDQYEQQIRAIAGLGLGNVKTCHPIQTIMLGQNSSPELEHIYKDSFANYYIYGEQKGFPNYDVGHVNVSEDSPLYKKS